MSKSISDTQLVLFHGYWSVIGDIRSKNPPKIPLSGIGDMCPTMSPSGQGTSSPVYF